MPAASGYPRPPSLRSRRLTAGAWSSASGAKAKRTASYPCPSPFFPDYGNTGKSTGATPGCFQEKIPGTPHQQHRAPGPLQGGRRMRIEQAHRPPQSPAHLCRTPARKQGRRPYYTASSRSQKLENHRHIHPHDSTSLQKTYISSFSK